MNFELFREVALTRDFPEHQLRRGISPQWLILCPTLSGGERSISNMRRLGARVGVECHQIITTGAIT